MDLFHNTTTKLVKKGKKMPRVQKRPERKIIRRKCYSCSKMATNPYVYHIVPSYAYGAQIPVYSKSDIKTKRVELKGKRKVLAYNYCNRECYENKKPHQPYGF
jgi:hypothetical protein